MSFARPRDLRVPISPAVHAAARELGTRLGLRGPRLFDAILESYLVGVEILILGPPPLTITLHRSHQEALIHMVPQGDWTRSPDGANRSFEDAGGVKWARIEKVQLGEIITK